MTVVASSAEFTDREAETFRKLNSDASAELMAYQQEYLTSAGLPDSAWKAWKTAVDETVKVAQVAEAADQRLRAIKANEELPLDYRKTTVFDSYREAAAESDRHVKSAHGALEVLAQELRKVAFGNPSVDASARLLLRDEIRSAVDGLNGAEAIQRLADLAASNGDIATELMSRWGRDQFRRYGADDQVVRAIEGGVLDGLRRSGSPTQRAAAEALHGLNRRKVYGLITAKRTYAEFRLASHAPR